MLRKLILSAAVAVMTLTGVASAAPAASPDLHDRDRDHRQARYEVLVRHRGHWDVYAVYRDRDDARRVVWRLRQQGHEARIEVKTGHW